MDVAKSQNTPEPIAEAVPSPASYAPTTRVQLLTRNVLSSDVEVVGSLRFSYDLLIDGTVEGDISSEGVLSVGQNAVIRAEINTKSVIIHGDVYKRQAPRRERPIPKPGGKSEPCVKGKNGSYLFFR